MKLIFKSKQLKEALAKLASLQSGTADPAASCCLSIICEDEFSGATMSRSTAEGAMRLSVPCDMQQGGEVHVAIGMLSSVVASLSAGDIEISSDAVGKVALIKCGRAKLTIPQIQKADRPASSIIIPEGPKITVPSESLLTELKLTSLAASRDRRELMNVTIGRIHGRMMMYAVDGRRFNATEFPEPAPALDQDEACFATIPTSSLSSIERFLGGTKGSAKICQGSSRVFVTVNDDVMSIASGEYHGLNVSAIMPTEISQLGVTLNTDEFKAAMKCAIPVGLKDTQFVRLQAEDGGAVNISSESELGGLSQEMELAGKNSACDIYFSPIFMLDLIAFAGNEETITLGMGIAGAHSLKSVSVRAGSRLGLVCLKMPT